MMSEIKPIRNEADHEAALTRIEELFDAALGTPEGDELDVLTVLVERYESIHYPIGPSDPIDAIEFQMDQKGMTPRNLIPIIGSRAKVSEVLARRRPITMPMARALHQHLGIPAEVLLRDPAVTQEDNLRSMEWARFPLRAMVKLDWIPSVPRLKDHAEELVSRLMDRAGGQEFAAQPMYRKNDQRRVNAKTDDYALKAWCWEVIARARERGSSVNYQPGTVTRDFLRDVAQLSMSDDGPIRAKKFLAHHGIAFEYVPHLPRTHLDGAALRLPDGGPVVGVTLRYDRIDNFWFTLLHELSHVSLHLDGGAEDEGFVDDHSLRGMESEGDTKERDADEKAQNALIPPGIWGDGEILEHPTPMAVVGLGWEAGVHPAIIAGRIRRELGNYRLLSQFVGTGEVRGQFEVLGS